MTASAGAGDAMKDRAAGCLLGQLAGDSLGSLVEFRSAAVIADLYPDGGPHDLVDGGHWDTLAGQPTDDSEMALSLARTLVRLGRFDSGEVRAGYVRWRQSSPFDIGNTTSRALGGGGPDDRSQANGSLMRVSPIGIFAAGDPERAAGLAAADSAMTHPHPVCRAACRAYCAAIAAAIAGDDAAAMVVVARRYAGDDAGADTVRATIERALDGPPGDYLAHQGWVLIALHNAFHQLTSGRDLEQALIATVRCGGDTDTNGAIAGALLGAGGGAVSVPARWKQAILACRPSRESGARHPRPCEYWPADAIELAHALLLAGGAVLPPMLDARAAAP